MSGYIESYTIFTCSCHVPEESLEERMSLPTNILEFLSVASILIKYVRGNNI